LQAEWLRFSPLAQPLAQPDETNHDLYFSEAAKNLVCYPPPKISRQPMIKIATSAMA
jgi:hypothetical protein